MKTLLPCPLCGCEVTHESTVTQVTIRCSCGISLSVNQDPQIKGNAECTASARWNRRRLDIGGFRISMEPEFAFTGPKEPEEPQRFFKSEAFDYPMFKTWLEEVE